MNKTIRYMLLITLFCFLFLPGKSSADWVHSFVVYDGYTYVISEAYVTDIDKNIGRVTKYSDKEGTYYGNFSNTFKKGTKYYSIKGVSTETAIAVSDNGKYVKANREGEYAGPRNSPLSWGVIGMVLISLFLLIVIMFEMKVTS